MTKVPNVDDYPVTNEIHPKVLKRIIEVQGERFVEHYPAPRIDEILDPEKFRDLFDKA